MTLDECILHAEEVAESQEQKANSISEYFGTNKGTYSADVVSKCRKCAEEHRQLAEWLKDYKRLLAIESGIDVRCGNCKHDGIDSDRCNECYWYSKWEEESD